MAVGGDGKRLATPVQASGQKGYDRETRIGGIAYNGRPADGSSAVQDRGDSRAVTVVMIHVDVVVAGWMSGIAFMRDRRFGMHTDALGTLDVAKHPQQMQPAVMLQTPACSDTGLIDHRERQ